MKIKFFLKKGPVDGAANESMPIFTPYLAFRMNDSSMQK